MFRKSLRLGLIFIFLIILTSCSKNEKSDISYVIYDKQEEINKIADRNDHILCEDILETNIKSRILARTGTNTLKLGEKTKINVQNISYTNIYYGFDYDVYYYINGQWYVENKDRNSWTKNIFDLKTNVSVDVKMKINDKDSFLDNKLDLPEKVLFSKEFYKNKESEEVTYVFQLIEIE